jgi:hypothetical protein
MIPKSGTGFRDQIMRYVKKLARDRTQNRYPLLLIAREGTARSDLSLGWPYFRAASVVSNLSEAMNVSSHQSLARFGADTTRKFLQSRGL